jgi:hypothetical protein
VRFSISHMGPMVRHMRLTLSLTFVRTHCQGSHGHLQLGEVYTLLLSY